MLGVCELCAAPCGDAASNSMLSTSERILSADRRISRHVQICTNKI
jgi:hypothetical protein